MNEHNPIRRIMPLIKCGMLLAWYFAVSVIVSSAVYAGIKDPAIYGKYVEQNENKLMIVIYLMLFFGIWAFDNHKKDFLGVFKKWEIRNVIKYVMYGIGAYLVSNVITSVLLPFFPDYAEIGSMFSKNQFLLSFIGTVILAPIVEEYLFRYKIQGYLKQILKAKYAIIVQAVLFGILHGYMIQKIYAMLIGVFFGYVDEKRGTVQCSIIMHMTVNGIGWLIGCFLIH